MGFGVGVGFDVFCVRPWGPGVLERQLPEEESVALETKARKADAVEAAAAE